MPKFNNKICSKQLLSELQSELSLYAEIISIKNRYFTYIIIFGGLLFNYKPLQNIFTGNYNIIFIDSNQFENQQELLKLFELLNRFILKQQSISINFPPKIIIGGYSYGGLLAINFIASYNIKQAKLLLLNSTPCFIKNNSWDGILELDFINLSNKLEKLSLHNFKKYFFNLCNSVPNPPQIPQTLKIGQTSDDSNHMPQPFNHQLSTEQIFSKYATNKSTILYHLEQIYKTDLREALSLISHPPLIIQSKLDALVPANNKYYQNLKNKAIVHTINANHIDFRDTTLNLIIGQCLN